MTENPDDLAIYQNDGGEVRFVGFIDPSTLKPDPDNANEGTPYGMEMLERSFEDYGAGRSVLIDRNNYEIAGNKTIEKAVAKGFKVAVVETDGNTLIAVKRKDLDLINDPKARGLAYMDNQVGAKNLQWSLEQIARDAENMDLSGMGIFSKVEIEDIQNRVSLETFDEMENEFGEFEPSSLTGTLSFRNLPEDLLERYRHLTNGVQGDDVAKFRALIEWAERGKEAAA